MAVRSARLLTLPILNLVLSALATYGGMYVVASTIPVISATMSLITSVLIAFCFDYSLFLLSRFGEARRAGGKSDMTELVIEMLETAGHNCAVSGCTLLFAFFSLVLVPQATLRGLGMGSFVALLFAILCNLTVTPIMLLLFERFYLAGVAPVGTYPAWVPRRVAQWWTADASAEALEANAFYRLGKRLTAPWPAALVIVGLVAFCASFAYPAVTFSDHISDSFLLALPRGDPFSNAVLRMAADFGKGFLNSYRILVVPPEGTEIFTDAQFQQALKGVVDAALSVGNLTCGNVMSPFLSGCRSISPLLYKACEAAPLLSASCPDLLRLKQATVAPRGDAAVVTLWRLSFDAEGTFGLDWYRRLLAAMPSSIGSSRIFVDGGEGWDGVIVALGYFPLMVGLR